jgi:hypothetical protein
MAIVPFMFSLERFPKEDKKELGSHEFNLRQLVPHDKCSQLSSRKSYWKVLYNSLKVYRRSLLIRYY